MRMPNAQADARPVNLALQPPPVDELVEREDPGAVERGWPLREVCSLKCSCGPGEIPSAASGRGAIDRTPRSIEAKIILVVPLGK
jgi:hypothetical protein